MSDLKIYKREKAASKNHNQVSPAPSMHSSVRSLSTGFTRGYGSETLSPQVISQLQRTIGNRATLQLMRERSLTITRVGDQRIQPDRLVEIHSGDDDKDFNSTRDKVQTGLGVASSGQWMVARFGEVGATEVLYIWGHMTSTRIGNVDFPDLAKYMVKQGFRTCASIRLIGCNNQDNFDQAPRTLWNALKLKFEEKGLTDAVPPTIYATKGTLHSGLEKKIYPLEQWWIGTPTSKEEAMKLRLAAIEKKLRGEALPPEYTDDIDDDMDWFNMQAGGIGIEVNIANLPRLFEKLRMRVQVSTKEKKPDAYPTLKRPVEGEKEGEMEWHPDAWTRYP